MNYYYDIILNFSENNLMFYEWLDSDNYEYFKKIPFFQVTSSTMQDLLSNDIQITESFLTNIKNKAKTKANLITYACIFVDKNTALAMEFNDEGKSIARSFLSVEDDLNIIELLYTTRLENIEYKIIGKKEYKENLRIEDKIKLLIKTEINNLIEKKDFIKLRYLYYEWFNEDTLDNELLVTRMLNELNKKVSKNEINIYNLIKLSYSKV